MIIIKDLLSQLCDSGIKGLEGVQHHLYSFLESVGLIGFGNRGIDIISAQVIRFQPAGLEVKIALEGRGIGFANIQQGRYSLIRDVVLQVADSDRALVIAQVNVFICPVPDYGLVNLAQDGPIITINSVELLVNGCPEVWIGMAGVHH